MERDAARKEIRRGWREIMGQMTKPAKRKVNGELSYICPICSNGSGRDGDGLVWNPKSEDGVGLKCFKCDFSGDIIDLQMQVAGEDYDAALRSLAQKLGIEIDPYRPEAGMDWMKRKTERPDRHVAASSVAVGGARMGALKSADLPEDFTAYYEECKGRLSDPAAVEYLRFRGISPATAAAHHVGYDPKWVSPKALREGKNPPATPRLIIPSSKSHYVARDTRRNVPKEQQYFEKPNIGSICIFNESVLYAQETQVVFIVEGAIDALSIIEAGAPAVALNSTSNARLLLEHLEAKRPTAILILCLDNDDAGRGKAAELREGLLRMQIPFTETDICGGRKDPNEALTADREGFIQAVRDAVQVARKQVGLKEGETMESRAQEVHSNYLDKFLIDVQNETYKPYETGLNFFDDLLGGGVIRQTLLLLLAAPGAGKTSLCVQIAEQMALRQKPVLYIPLEMSREQMIAKTISSRLARDGVSMSALDVLQGYRWTLTQKEAVLKEVGEYKEKIAPFLEYPENGTESEDGISSDIDAIRKYLMKKGDAAMVAGKDAPVVVLDYLHLISSKSGMDTQELVKQAVVMLKEYAIKYNTFVIGIVATNRESNKNGRITMQSGRDSSSLEYTADYQLSLNYYEIEMGRNGNKNDRVNSDDVDEMAKLQKKPWRKMILRVLKGRFVEPGRTKKVYFYAKSNTFYDEHGWIPIGDNKPTPFDDVETYTANKARRY